MKILIPRIGGDIGQEIVQCLLEHNPALQLVGVDQNSNCGWQAHVQEFIQEGQESWYREAIRFPYEQIGEKADICNDKLEVQRLLSANGIHGPATNTTGMRYYPCIFKPRKEHGSKGFHVVQNYREVKPLKELYNDGIFQEKLEGPEYTCPVYVTQDGEIRVIQLERTLMGGMTGRVIVRNNTHVEALCIKVAKLLGFKGAFNIQLILTPQGPKIFEINPRFSSTVYMRHLLGFKDAVWQLQELFGDKLDEYVLSKECKVVIRIQGAKII